MTSSTRLINQVITKTGIKVLVQNGLLDMSDLPTRRLSSIQVVLEVNNKIGLDVLTAPQKFHQASLINTLLHSFTLPEYALQIGISEKSRRNTAVQKFFTFLDTFSDASTEVPVRCFRMWREHLSDNESHFGVWLHTNALLKVLTCTLEKEYGKASNWPTSVHSAWLELKANTPKKPHHQKMKPLGMYLGIPPHHFNEHELYMGLRYGAIWLLKRLHSQREKLLSSPALAKKLESFKGHTLNSFERAFKWSVDEREAAFDLAPTFWGVITEDPLLAECQCYSIKALRSVLVQNDGSSTSPLSYEHQKMLLSRFINDDGSIRKRPKGYGRNDVEWEPLKALLGSAGRGNARVERPIWWGSDLVIHSRIERLLMMWLLASERAQTSGIERLTLDAVSIEGERPRSLQISTVKLRRINNISAKSGWADVETQIYRRGEPPFHVYWNWRNLEVCAKTFFAGYNPQKRFIYPMGSALSGKIATDRLHGIPETLLPLELLSVPGTSWQKEFLVESDDAQEAKAFIAILSNLVQKKHNHPDRTISLPASPIGQSLVIKKELENNWGGSHVQIDSEVIGHSKATGRNIYKDGFASLGVDEIVEPVHAFARRVGDEKFALAENLAEYLDRSSRRVSIAELEEICGIETPGRDQAKLLARLSEEDMMTIAGEVAIDGELLVVETDFTAALMCGYMRHLESGLFELMATDREESIIRHLSKYLYIHQTFERFGPGVRQAGQQLALEMAFPFPPLD